MKNMKVITKGSKNPQGLQKIYITGSSAAIRLYLEEIAENIFSSQNAAVYYRDPAEETESEQTIDTMVQLIIIIVTPDLFEELNGELRRKIAGFLISKVPVLPILIGDVSDEDFRSLFGDIQYLKKDAVDQTELPYHQKLAVFLNSVILGDEIADKIRSAFEAYIFLSYRKKDRVYAQELMHLIHENEFCRDIAIWYDEYLVPGENFNESIREALLKSDLFALLITPNLTNETNYVQSIEYPAAIQNEKKILPVEGMKTDRDKLAAYYPGLPEVIPYSDKNRLMHQLEKSFQEIAMRPQKEDPRHDFFIGLAYLGGVDVEMDLEKAYSLILSSARRGFPDACKKLSEMYEYGIGVSRDVRTAAKWQKFYIKILKDADKSAYLLNRDKLICACIRLGDLSRRIRVDCRGKTFIRSVPDKEALHEALSAYSDAIQLSETLMKEDGGPGARQLYFESLLGRCRCVLEYFPNEKLQDQCITDCKVILEKAKEQTEGRDTDACRSIILTAYRFLIGFCKEKKTTADLKTAAEYDRLRDEYYFSGVQKNLCGSVKSMCFHEGSSRLLLGFEGGQIKSVDPLDGSIKDYPEGFFTEVSSLYLSRKGRMLAAASGAGVKVFTAPDYQLSHRFLFPEDAVSDVKIAEDTGVLIVSVRKMEKSMLDTWHCVKILNLESECCIWSSEWTLHAIRTMISRDEKYLFLFHFDTIEAYNFEDGTSFSMRKGEAIPKQLLSYENEIYDPGEINTEDNSAQIGTFFDPVTETYDTCIRPTGKENAKKQIHTYKNAISVLSQSLPRAAVAYGRKVEIWDLMKFQSIGIFDFA